MVSLSGSAERTWRVEQYGIWIVIYRGVNTAAYRVWFWRRQHPIHRRRQKSRRDALCTPQCASMLGINLLLGGVSRSYRDLVPLAVSHLVGSGAELRGLPAGLRIASVLMLVRASRLSASEAEGFRAIWGRHPYQPLYQGVTVAAAVVLSINGFGVAGIMEAKACFLVLGTLPTDSPAAIPGAGSLFPSFDRHATAALFQFGALVGCSQSRASLYPGGPVAPGRLLGATTVTAYALCVQMAQRSMDRSLRAAFSFSLSSGAQCSLAPRQPSGKPSWSPSPLNFLLVAIEAGVLLLRPCVLNAWSANRLLKRSRNSGPITWSFAFLGLSVTGYYALLALGRVHMVTALNITGGLAMLLFMACLLPLQAVQWDRDGPSIYGSSRCWSTSARPCAGGRTDAFFVRCRHSPSL